jgi:hypothetical protein
MQREKNLTHFKPSAVQKFCVFLCLWRLKKVSTLLCVTYCFQLSKTIFKQWISKDFCSFTKILCDIWESDHMAAHASHRCKTLCLFYFQPSCPEQLETYCVLETKWIFLNTKQQYWIISHNNQWDSCSFSSLFCNALHLNQTDNHSLNNSV